jgi:hypothetical protein
LNRRPQRPQRFSPNRERRRARTGPSAEALFLKIGMCSDRGPICRPLAGAFRLLLRVPLACPDRWIVRFPVLKHHRTKPKYLCDLCGLLFKSSFAMFCDLCALLYCPRANLLLARHMCETRNNFRLTFGRSSDRVSPGCLVCMSSDRRPTKRGEHVNLRISFG